MCRTRKCTEGSNPSPSATSSKNGIIVLKLLNYLIIQFLSCGTGISKTKSLTKYSSRFQDEYLNKSNNINYKLIILKIRQTKCLLQKRRITFSFYLTGEKINNNQLIDNQDSDNNNIFNKLSDFRVIPVIRTNQAENAVAAVQSLSEAPVNGFHKFLKEH